MPDRRTHRGRHPEDARLFDAACLPALSEATGDLCWLLSRGYARLSALKLVGDRYDLVARQRIAVARCACSDADVQRRKSHRIDRTKLAGHPLWIDGYNALTTIEAAMSGGVLLLGRDGALRDMASMHGSYRKVSETLPAIELLGRVMADLAVGQCVWYLDRPVSNSGRLKGMLDRAAATHGWSWQVELVDDPDVWLAESDQIVATADSMILDRCEAWFNLARETVADHVPRAWVAEL